MRRYWLACLAALIIFALSACSVRQDETREKYVQAAPVGEYIESVHAPAGELTAREERILKQMSLTAENERLALYFGKYYDIAVHDKSAGKLFLSGDALYDSEGEFSAGASVMKYAATQVSVDYYDRNGVFHTKTSYPECYKEESLKQVTLEEIEGGVRVTYCLGQRNDQFVLAPVLTKDAYTEYKKLSETLAKDGVITKTASGNFVRAYKKLTYNTVSGGDASAYDGPYKNLPELGTIYVLAPNQTDKTKLNATVVSIAMGINQEIIDEQKALVGFDDSSADDLFYNDETDYFVVPIAYRLDGGDLIVSIEAENIERTEGIYPVQFHLLNTFAAVRTTDDGYLFLPDGSGSIIESDTSVYGITQTQLPFYGHDFGVSYDNFNNLPGYASMPVLGVTNGDKSVFAIVESGDAAAGAVGRVGIATLPYCCAYPYMTYFTRDYLNRASNVYSFSKVLPAGEFRVRYHFLYGDESNYSGMARYYRDYLTRSGGITPLAENEPLRLNLRLIGAINKTVRTLGVPNKQVFETTSFSEAKDILDYLHARGVEGVDVIYADIINGAREYKAPASISIQSELGGADGYNAFVNAAEQMGDSVYPSVDIGKVYKRGNTITGNDDVVGRISGDTAVIYDGITVPTTVTAPSFVNPERFASLSKAMCDSYRERLLGSNIYLPTLGYYLSGNYNEKFALSRTESKVLTADALRLITEERGLNVKLEGANLYALKYADSLTYVELDSGMSRLETYSVPFTSMVLKGSARIAGSPVNNSGDYEHEFLKMIENGADPFYEIMAADSDVLTDTGYSDLYSVSADIWLDEICSTLLSFEENGYASLANLRIRAHQRLDTYVFVTEYENGAEVVVNYGVEDYIYRGTTARPGGYAVIRGGNE